MKRQNDEITIKGLIDIFLPKLWIIAIVSLIAAMLVGGYSYFFKTETYTSKAKYLVVKIPSNVNADKTGVNMQEVEAMQHMVANAREIINTQDFCETVLEHLSVETLDELDRDDEHMQDLLDSLDEENSYLRSILTSINSQSISAKKIMSMLSISLSSNQTTCYVLSVTSTDAALSYAVSEVAGALLTQSFDDMGYAINISRIESPREAKAPNAKNTVRNTVIGFAAGFIASMLVVFVLDKFDVIIRSREKLEDNFDMPILGVIPRLESDE